MCLFLLHTQNEIIDYCVKRNAYVITHWCKIDTVINTIWHGTERYIGNES